MVKTELDQERPQVLLLASRYDLTCDYVVAQLRASAIPYLRLNSEDIGGYAVELDPLRRRLILRRNETTFCVTPESLQSVLFRRPVFLRDYGDDQTTPAERFSRHQWAAFIRNLMLFDEAHWINDPGATYRAEHKALQLSVAVKVGFAVPQTRVTNSPHPHLLGGVQRVAIKGVDTVLLRAEAQEVFGFTTFEESENLEPAAWQAAPATIQTALTNKLDIRVTVVEKEVFAASIRAKGRSISEDWRKDKSSLTFDKWELPPSIAQRCQTLVQGFGLRFGAIDLALCDEEYYFLEINPTGEWAWLVDAAGLPIDVAIANALIRGALTSAA